MSAASEKSAREWRERGTSDPPPHRWWVCKAPLNYGPPGPWRVFAPIVPPRRRGGSFPAHAEAINYATEQVREGIR